jgi:serine/threonine-protein kinase
MHQMRPTIAMLALACSLAACSPASLDAAPKSPPSSPAAGCGSGGGGPTGGPADLFPCDSNWYKDVSGLPASAESSSIIGAIQAAGGWGNGNHFQIGLGYALIHADASVARREVWMQSKDANDGNVYYPNESDLISPGRGWSVPTPASGHLEGESGYRCPQSWVNGKLVNQHDCHLMVVDDARHLLIELYGANLDPETGRWYATQESVWNLNYHYGAAQRGRGCTSADAAGLAYSAGIIGLRETAAAAQSGGYLHHALRFILPNDRTRRAFVAPASHAQVEARLISAGPPYGTRLRLRPDFDEGLIASPGGKVVARTLKRYAMILADGGETALVGDDEAFVRSQDGSSLSWSGLLAPLDLDAIRVSDFEVVDYDSSTLTTAASCSGIDRAPLAVVTPQGFKRRPLFGPLLRRQKARATSRAPALWQ